MKRSSPRCRFAFRLDDVACDASVAQVQFGIGPGPEPASDRTKTGMTAVIAGGSAAPMKKAAAIPGETTATVTAAAR